MINSTYSKLKLKYIIPLEYATAKIAESTITTTIFILVINRKTDCNEFGDQLYL